MATGRVDAEAVFRADISGQGVSDLAAVPAETLVEFAVRYAIWLPVDTYARGPWLAPYAIRRLRVRTDPRAPGPKRDLWGMPDESGYFADDNSLIKGVVKDLPVSAGSPYGAGRIGTGLVCCHVWPGTTANPLLFSFVPNLVWLPRSLASYSDAHLAGPPHAVHETLKAVSVRRYRGVCPAVARPRSEAAWRCLPLPTASAPARASEFVAGDRVASLALKRTTKMIRFLEATVDADRPTPHRFSRRYHAGIGPAIDLSVWPVQDAVTVAARCQLISELQACLASGDEERTPPQRTSPQPPDQVNRHRLVPRLDSARPLASVAADEHPLHPLGPVSEAELAEFGEWLVRTRALTPRPVSDYQSRVRRVARGVDVSTLTPKSQASLRTAVRAFLEFRH
jgi:hypothetical protein